MHAPDPFALIAPGQRVQLELAPDQRARFVVDFVRRGLSTIWCHLGPERELPDLTVTPRVLTLEAGDQGGLLKVPVMVASVDRAERSDGKVLTASLKVLSGTIWVQRRKYFRLRQPPLGVTLRPAGVAPDASAELPARPLNLGGGGLALAVNGGEIRPGDEVEIQLVLANTPLLPARGTVLRVEPGAGVESVLAVQFTDIRESHRDRLVSLIFREQTRRRLTE
ncbi:MAG: PilZ domain-containing protein [Deltaproteobacteria bacterium]|nr:PilZ domain-containing protein [Myxococcales bacterium]MDP3218304.1 PilZ domain-containing protein [Deltaproteobacteria bacterium]